MIHPLAALKHAILSSPVPTATLLIGIPGSGKSTWIKQSELKFDFVAIISTDDIIDALAIESACTYSEMWKQVKFRDIQQQMFAKMQNAIAMEQSIIVDRTNIDRKARNKILCKLPPHYHRLGAVFTCDLVELDRRLRERAEKTGKYIDPVVVQDMLNRYEEPTTDEFDEIFL
jgi:predicted kinase